MKNRIEHEVFEDYLEVRLYGVIDPEVEKEEAMARWTKIVALCEREKRKKALVISYFKGVYKINTSFTLVENANNLGWNLDYKLAMAVPDEDRFNRLLFIENAMIQYGYDMKLFRNKREAKKWLLS
ncbi:hypothetical protein [Muriicola sp.]|uniref:hypothetical protein n=1 Tax=Muriicola sp. TaxID=2020856 RepID=UPI003C764056